MSAGTIHAQQGVHGIVTALASGEPIPDAQVYVQRLKRGTVTDSAGRYTLDHLSPGLWAIEFSCLGFQKRLQTLVLSEHVMSTLDVTLEPATLEAGEVVILAEDPGHTAEIPLATLSIDRLDRAERGRMSLWENLGQLPGMSRSTNGPGIERPYIRGLSAGRILVLMQGLPYAFQTWDPEAGLAVNGNETEQVDVIQGPAALRYGPGAMGGVIDLTPEYPAPTGRTVGSFTGRAFSNTEGLHGELALKQSRPGWFWGARGGLESHADYKAGGESEREEQSGREEEEGRVPNSRYEHVDAQVFGGLSRNWGSTRLTYQFLRHRNGIVETEDEESGEEERGEREIVPPYHALLDHILTSDTQVRLGQGWLHGIVGLQVNRQQEYEPGGVGESKPEGEAAIDLSLTTFHTRLDYEAGLAESWSLTTGVQGSVQHSESEGREPFIPNAERRQLGAFGLLTWRKEDVVIESGLRYDFQTVETSPAEGEEAETSVEAGGEEAEIERDFRLISGSLGGTYQAGEGRYIKLNVGAGNRAPDVAELTSNGLLREIRRFLIGDRNLNAEYNLEADATVDWELDWVSLSAGAFLNRIFEYTYLFADGESIDGFPVFRYRQGDADFRGGHAGIRVRPPTVQSVTLLSRFDIVRAELSDSPGYSLPMIPAPRIRNAVEISCSRIGALGRLKFRAEIETYLEQNHVPPWETSSNGYSLVNASINARVPWGSRVVMVGLHGLNLLDTEYTSHLSLLKRDGIPDIGRSITVSVVAPFGW